MTNHIEDLLRGAGETLCDHPPRLSALCADLAGELRPELLQMLWFRNGFTAFGGALQVYPAGESERLIMDLDRWNSPSPWRSAYKHLADGCLFFAQDVFGMQFCISGGAVYRFNPETAEKEYVAPTLNEWALLMCEEPAVNTGVTLLTEWQRSHGVLADNKRLVPKIPFVLGGDFAAQNLHAMEAVNAMGFYADLAIQIYDLPDGAKVRLKVVD